MSQLHDKLIALEWVKQKASFSSTKFPEHHEHYCGLLAKAQEVFDVYAEGEIVRSYRILSENKDLIEKRDKDKVTKEQLKEEETTQNN